MDTNFLGKLVHGATKTVLFLDEDGGAIVQATSAEKSTIVQAFKRLVLSESHLKKGLQLEHLHTILSAYNSSLEIHTSAPDEEWVKKLEPLKNRKKSLLEFSLKKVEKELEQEEDEYLEWKGVRDLDEAHYHLKNRQDEIFDLNQKLVHNAQEPQFIYSPGPPLRRTVSAWQTTDRIRFKELKEQTKERVSAVRLRIDFTRRIRIKDLKDKRKEILSEFEDERKRERDYEKTIARVVDESVGGTLVLTVRSRAVEVQGRRNEIVRQCAEEVHETASRLKRTLKERLGMSFVDAPVAMSGLCDAGQTLPRALVPAENFGLELKKVITAVLESKPGPARLPEIHFPIFDKREGRRFAYLGLALREDLSRTTFPILFDLDLQGVRHTIATGASGSGKSFAASLIAEGALHHNIPVLVFDPTRSWTGFAEPCSSKSQLEAYEDFGLDRGFARGYETTIIDPDEDDASPIEGITGSKGITVVTPSKLTETQQLQLFGDWLKGLYNRVQTMPESSKLVLLVVIEEAHRFKGRPEVEELLELFARTARVRGVGLLLCTQVLTDLSPGIRSNAGTHLLLKTSYTQDLTRAGQIAGREVQKLLPKLNRGMGVVHFPDYGPPALVAFRPPLHAQTAVPEAVAAMAQGLGALRQVTGALTRHVATGDTTATENVASSENAVEPSQEGNTTGRDKGVATRDATDWRDVASRFLGAEVPASVVLKAIREAGLEPPGLRTIQRFMKTARTG